MNSSLPVVVIGAGPVGLAAAAHLLDRGLTPLVMEAGGEVGAGMRRWAHIRMFSPWEYTFDKMALALLRKHGWTSPDPADFPTGGEVVERYLQPLAKLPEIQPHLRTGTRVMAVTKHGCDRLKDAQRNDVPFVVRYTDSAGEHELLAQAVIDASGTVETPNFLGASGIPALGEQGLQENIFYGMPHVLASDRERYAGKRVLVIGGGHSAFNVLKDLTRLADQVPGMQIQWAIRQPSVQRILGGGDNDQLKERGRLGMTIGRLLKDGVLTVAVGFHLERLERTSAGIVARGAGKSLSPVDEIVGATGFRPNLGLLSELRIALDLGTQAPLALAPLIDPNQHSCGSVRPHGAEELKHPDANVYIVGMKSYGRAPTFLLLTGYEQVRSVVAAIAGDWEAARRVELVLPETGVCITQFAEEDAAEAAAATACCSGPAPAGRDACCVKDADSKEAGGTGCGCGTPVVIAPVVKPSSCCR